MTDLRQAAQQALEALEGWEHCDKWVWPETALEQSKRNTTESLAALRTALEQQAEPSQWRDMVVVSLVREGIDKHKARELADHFAAQQQAEPVGMRMPKVGDKVICLEDESLGEVVSLTGGGSPDITFDDGTRGTYLLREFAELFGYVAAPQRQAEPVAYFDFQEHKFSWAKHMKIGPVPVSIKVDPMKLYSEAPQHPWQGLTDEDFLEACQLAERGNYLVAFQRIQIKLKERNT